MTGQNVGPHSLKRVGRSITFLLASQVITVQGTRAERVFEYAPGRRGMVGGRS